MKLAVSAFATTGLASMALLVWTPAGPTAAQVAAPGGSGLAESTAQSLPSPVPHPNTPNRPMGLIYADPLAGDHEAAQLYEEEVEAAREAQSLTIQFQQASSDEDRTDLRQQLREALLRQFEAQQARRTREIESIEERLAAYKEKVQKREEAKDLIVDRRLDQLAGVGDDLGWEETAVGPHAGHPGGPMYGQPGFPGRTPAPAYFPPTSPGPSATAAPRGSGPTGPPTTQAEPSF